MSDARRAAKEAYLASLAAQKATQPQLPPPQSAPQALPPPYSATDRPMTERDRIFEERRQAFLRKQQQPLTSLHVDVAAQPLQSVLKNSPSRGSTASSSGQRPGTASTSPKKRVQFDPQRQQAEQLPPQHFSFDEPPRPQPQRQQHIQPSEVNLNNWRREGYPSEFAYAKAMGVLDMPPKQRAQPDAPMQRFESPPKRSAPPPATHNPYSEPQTTYTYDNYGAEPVRSMASMGAAASPTQKRERQAEYAQRLQEDQQAKVQLRRDQHVDRGGGYTAAATDPPPTLGVAFKGMGERSETSPERKHQQQAEFARQLDMDNRARQRIATAAAGGDGHSGRRVDRDRERSVGVEDGVGGGLAIGHDASKEEKRARQAAYARELQQQQGFRQHEGALDAYAQPPLGGGGGGSSSGGGGGGGGAGGPMAWASPPRSVAPSSSSAPRGINALGSSPEDAKAAKRARQQEYAQSLLSQQMTKGGDRGRAEPVTNPYAAHHPAATMTAATSAAAYQGGGGLAFPSASDDKDAKRARQVDYARALQAQQAWALAQGGPGSPSAGGRREFHNRINHLSPPKAGSGGGASGVLDEGWVLGPMGLPVRRTLQTGNRNVQKAYNQAVNNSPPRPSHGGPPAANPYAFTASPAAAAPHLYPPPQPSYDAAGSGYQSGPPPPSDPFSFSGDLYGPPPGTGHSTSPARSVPGAYPHTAALLRDPRTALDGDVGDERKAMEKLMKQDQARALEEQIRANAARTAADKAKRENEELAEERRLEAERKAIADAFEKEKTEAKQRAEEANRAALARQMEEKRKQKEDEQRAEEERMARESEKLRREQEEIQRREADEMQREAENARKARGSPPPQNTYKQPLRKGMVLGPVSPAPPGRNDLFGPPSPAIHLPPPAARSNGRDRPPQTSVAPARPASGALREVRAEALEARAAAEQARREVDRLRDELLARDSLNQGPRTLQRSLPRPATADDDEVFRLDRTLDSDSFFVFPDGSSYRLSTADANNGGGGADGRIRRSASAGGDGTGRARGGRPRVVAGDAAAAGGYGPVLDLRGIGTPMEGAPRLGASTKPMAAGNGGTGYLDLQGFSSVGVGRSGSRAGSARATAVQASSEMLPAPPASHNGSRAGSSRGARPASALAFASDSAPPAAAAEEDSGSAPGPEGPDAARPPSGGGALAATADQVHDQLDALLRNLRRMAGPPDPTTLAAATSGPASPADTPPRRAPGLWGADWAASAAVGGGSRPSSASTSAPDTARSARVRIPGDSKWLSVGPDADDAFRPAGRGASTLSAAALRNINASGFSSPVAAHRGMAAQTRTPPSSGGGRKLMQRGRAAVSVGADNDYDDYSEYGL